MTIQTPITKSRLNLSRYISDDHKRAAKVLGFALTLGTFDAWRSAGVTWVTSLSKRECAGLAYTALRALDPEDAQTVATSVLGDGPAGAPIASLDDHIEDAALWTGLADPDELEAYCLACFEAMPAGRQAAFLEFVQGRKVA